MADLSSATEITSYADLRALLGEPTPRAAGKDRRRLTDLDRQWLAASPMCLVATSAPDGSCDVSPKGDPPGFTLVLDDTTIVLPERPGNRRVDGFRNVIDNPHVGLIFLVPGRGDTLRVNGRARLLSDAPFFDAMVVKGHRPALALLVEVEQVFSHCSKAFLRSQLWACASWLPDELASQAQIAHRPGGEQSLEELEQYYGPQYANRLYES